MDYRAAGVDISKGDRLVERIKAMMGAAGSRIGHFGGAFPFPVKNYTEPLLVSSIDSVGTKTAVAIAMNKHDTVGMDMVHHSVNDIACCGAEPLCFLDYFAMGVMDVDIAAEVIGGVVKACEKLGVALVGGENAEMPGVYREGEYDLVGSITGVVDKADYIDGSGISEGDIILGFGSNGLHTNGYSLARKVFETNGIAYNTYYKELQGTVGDALLEVHRCYLREIRELKSRCRIKALAHITGGGLEGNTRRVIPKGLKAEFDWDSWDAPPIFRLIENLGKVPVADMRSTFNMGIGLTVVVSPEDVERVILEFPDELVSPVVVGRVVRA